MKKYEEGSWLRETVRIIAEKVIPKQKSPQQMLRRFRMSANNAAGYLVLQDYF
jgi:hypothetical protein